MESGSNGSIGIDDTYQTSFSESTVDLSNYTCILVKLVSHTHGL